MLIPFDVIMNKDSSVNQKRFTKFANTVEQFHKKIGGRMFLDCGAYSAKHRGFTIDVQQYIKFVKGHKDWFHEIVALDVIGDSETTWNNYCSMREAGLDDTILVYHVNEPPEALKRISDNSEYFGIGIPSTLKRMEQIEFYWHNLYNYGEATLKYPNNKVHGFGIGAPTFFQAYPWESCDASNASICARMGMVPIVRNLNGFFEVVEVPVSSRQKKDAGHYDNLPESMRVELDRYMEKFGYTILDFDEDSLDFEGDALHNRMLFSIQMIDEAISWLNTGKMKQFLPQPKLF